MKSIVKPVLIVIGVLFLLIVVGLLSNRFPMQTVPRLKERALLEDKLESDQLFQDLETIASSIQKMEKNKPKSPLDMSEDDLNMYILQNGNILASFHLLFRQKYMGKLMIEGRNARTPRVKTHQDPYPEYSHIRALSNLLLCQAHHQLKNEFAEEGYDSLEAVSQLNRSMLQNPSLIELMIGLHQVSQTNRYMLESGMSFPAESSHWLPETSFLLHGLEQAIYSEYTLMENLFDSDDLQASLDDEFVKWGSEFLCNKEMSIGYLVEDFDNHLQALKTGILTSPGTVVRFNKINPIHWCVNPIGRILLGIAMPLYESFNMKVCIYIWQSDATRLFLALRNQNMEQTKEHTQSVLDQLNLINPATQKPYLVSEDGRLILLPAESDNWKQIKAVFLEPLHGFPVVLPVSDAVE